VAEPESAATVKISFIGKWSAPDVAAREARGVTATTHVTSVRSTPATATHDSMEDVSVATCAVVHAP